MIERIRAYKDDEGVLHIHRNAEGLRWLSEVCLGMVAQVGGGGHYNFGPIWNNTEEDSAEFMVCYDKELENPAIAPSP